MRILLSFTFAISFCAFSAPEEANLSVITAAQNKENPVTEVIKADRKSTKLLAQAFAFSHLALDQLADNVYQFTSYKVVEPWGRVGGKGLVVINGNDAHLIDTPWTQQATQEMLDWLAANHLNLRTAIITHYHDDASGGVALLNQNGVATYATSLTNALLAEHDKPTTTKLLATDNKAILDNMGEYYYAGKGHTLDNIVVWLAEEKILFGGCLVKSLVSKSLGNIADANISEWPKTMMKLEQRYKGAEIVVPGHGSNGGIELLDHTKRLANAKNELRK